MMQIFLENRASIQKLFVVALFLVALWRGSGPERACAGVLIGMVIVQLALRDFTGLERTYGSLDPVLFTIDVIGLAGFVGIALRANRFYPLVLAAAQLVAFMAHLARALVEPVSSLAYYLLIAMPFWFQIIVLGIGIARHIHQTGRQGPYGDWRQAGAVHRPVSVS